MTRLPTPLRKQTIAEAAFAVAAKEGLSKLNREKTAAAAGCSTGTVSRYYDGEGLRVAALRIAVDRRHKRLCKHLLGGDYAGVVKLPADLREELLTPTTK